MHCCANATAAQKKRSLVYAYVALNIIDLDTYQCDKRMLNLPAGSDHENQNKR